MASARVLIQLILNCYRYEYSCRHAELSAPSEVVSFPSRPVAAAAVVICVREGLRNLCRLWLALCTLIWGLERFGHALTYAFASSCSRKIQSQATLCVVLADDLIIRHQDHIQLSTPSTHHQSEASLAVSTSFCPDGMLVLCRRAKIGSDGLNGNCEASAILLSRNSRIGSQ